MNQCPKDDKTVLILTSKRTEYSIIDIGILQTDTRCFHLPLLQMIRLIYWIILAQRTVLCRMRNTSKRTSIPKKVANLKEVYCFNESTGYILGRLKQPKYTYKTKIKSNRRFDNHYLNFGKVHSATINR
jgi:hypothetical protein